MDYNHDNYCSVRIIYYNSALLISIATQYYYLYYSIIVYS